MIVLEALFKLTYGMYIASSKKNNRFNGCIVNSVFQLTPDPLMVGMSLNKKSLTNDYITDSNVFGVSILSQNAPMSFIGKFGFRSGRDTNKFEQVNSKIGRTGVPIILDNTICFIEAEVTQTIDLVTHTLFIAKIVASQPIDGHGEPMTYAYYRDVKQGKTPEIAATYVAVKSKSQLGKKYD